MTISGNRGRARWTTTLRVCAFTLAAVAFMSRTSAFAQGPVLQLDHLSRLADKAREVVDITVDETMLKQSSGLLTGKSSPAAQAMSGLKGVYVKSFEFDEEGGYTQADVDAVVTQLKAPWSKLLSVREHGERTEMYVFREGEEVGGLALVVAEQKELTIINLVGRIDLKQLSSLGGLAGIPGAVLGAASAVQGSPSSTGKAPAPGPTRDRQK